MGNSRAPGYPRSARRLRGRGEWGHGVETLKRARPGTAAFDARLRRSLGLALLQRPDEIFEVVDSEESAPSHFDRAEVSRVDEPAHAPMADAESSRSFRY